MRESRSKLICDVCAKETEEFCNPDYKPKDWRTVGLTFYSDDGKKTYGSNLYDVCGGCIGLNVRDQPGRDVTQKGIFGFLFRGKK